MSYSITNICSISNHHISHKQHWALSTCLDCSAIKKTTITTKHSLKKSFPSTRSRDATPRCWLGVVVVYNSVYVISTDQVVLKNNKSHHPLRRNHRRNMLRWMSVCRRVTCGESVDLVSCKHWISLVCSFDSGPISCCFQNKISCKFIFAEEWATTMISRSTVMWV